MTTRSTSRAAHPAAAPDDESWLRAIAAGLARAVSSARSEAPPCELRATLLLETPAYRAWAVDWPAGTSVAIPDSLDVQSFSVIDGRLDLVERLGRTSFAAGEDAVVTAPGSLLHAPVRCRAVHVVLLGPRGAEQALPWTVRSAA